ncbi:MULTISPECIES: acyl-CoA dehydrogenase family protein [Mycolicibacter]|uniref:Acyl-CoA dehydrogenase n=1 Tax=Mycolicibacter kumamotonensis TaxID=354243 RepID=A0A7K3LCH7_9MYCO|nr:MULTISPECIES: acyl-CoA dehydrogenase family protein [Mycolicibacter]NDJ90069.1 acyl-CoA dehydrogenase [Mycolicibacter kumamotonensis]RAV01830.1 acyl-CoA dehydrogenase [Mycolicibacter senuensis]
MSALSGGIFDSDRSDDDTAELRALVDDIGRRSFETRLGQRGVPERFDPDLWRTLEDTGLARLTSTPDLDAGPVESAVVLYGLARYAGAVPIAETDLLAAWLGQRVGIELPSGPLTVAIADARHADGRVSGVAHDVPWTRACAAVLLAGRIGDQVWVGTLNADDPQMGVDSYEGHNLAGEPRDRITFDVAVDRLHCVDRAVADELVRRGAWARCAQTIGALDAAAALSVDHTRDRVQFGRPLSRFQAVQHVLAAMAGDIERARAAATLAVAAAADHGFASAQTDFAVTAAKVTIGRVTAAVTTAAHQLHGAIGVTVEHPLWLATMRAQSWVADYGSTGHYAQLLGRATLAAQDPWDVLIGDKTT